jgi:hypothetical protein
MQLPCNAIQRCNQPTSPQAPNFSSAAHPRTHEVQIHSSLLQILLVHRQSCQASLHVKHYVLKHVLLILGLLKVHLPTNKTYLAPKLHMETWYNTASCKVSYLHRVHHLTRNPTIIAYYGKKLNQNQIHQNVILSPNLNP